MSSTHGDAPRSGGGFSRLNPEALREMADRLHAEADAQTEDEPFGTAEHWYAIGHLHQAAREAYTAARWLEVEAANQAAWRAANQPTPIKGDTDV